MISKQKTVEVRLLKEKSSKIQVGDYITFTNQEDETKKITAEVINKKIYNTLEDLLKDYNVNKIMPNHTNNDLKELLTNIYKDNLKTGSLVAFELKYN